MNDQDDQTITDVLGTLLTNLKMTGAVLVTFQREGGGVYVAVDALNHARGLEDKLMRLAHQVLEKTMREAPPADFESVAGIKGRA